MSKGKQTTISKSAYDSKINQQIDNRMYVTQESRIPDEKRDYHSDQFYRRYFVSSQGTIKITRDVLSMSDSHARKKFLAMVRNFEELNEHIKLHSVSKDELYYILWDFIEETNCTVHLADDARQFLLYRFMFPDILKLYFYKLFYPRIFDFTVITDNGKETIKFRSRYIEKHFISIFLQIEKLCISIIYDGITIAVEKTSVRHIEALKTYQLVLTPSDSVEDISYDLDSQINAFHDNRKFLLETFAPSLVFFAKHYGYFYHNRTVPEKKISVIINSTAFFEGKRSDDSRNALKKTYADCAEILKQIPTPFMKLLNAYHINKNSCLYDLNILKDNVHFMPYALDGILVKHHLSQMMTENNKKIQETKSTLNLSSTYNNPNCIIQNLTHRDYEMINFLISRTAKTFELYYLTTEEIKEIDDPKQNAKPSSQDKQKTKIKIERDVQTSTISDLMDIINKQKRTTAMAELIPEFESLITNHIDYNLAVDWTKPFRRSDAMQG